MANKRHKKINQRDNYLWLLAALLILSIAAATASQFDSQLLRSLTSMGVTAIVLVAVWSTQRDQWPFSSRVAASTLFILFESGEFLLDYYHLETVQLVMLLLFTIGTIVLACRQVLLTGGVDSNKIVGSICIFMLLALAWAEAYLLVERFLPGSVPALSGAHWRDQLHESIYFSYVTLSSVGYGDISPAQPLARMLAYMQAITGQFYIAIVVASLIGAKMSDDKRR